MTIRSANKKLRLVAPSDIKRNPENPRLVFRQDEMEALMLSIDRHGIQVPLTVYPDGKFFTLLDGERRWRCAKKLNLEQIPTIIQEQPSELENLVLMYNIHSLREQWDYFTIASKIQRMGNLYEAENGVYPGEAILSELTGLSRGAIRRCQLLINLPERFKEMILTEIEKPKSQQKLTEDLFIELEKALKTVTKRIPGYQDSLDEIRDVLVSKYRKGTIGAVTDFRQLSKIATAVDGLGIAQKTAFRALDKIFDPKQKIGIKEAYSETVEFEYGEKKAARYVLSLIEFIDAVAVDDRESELDSEFSKSLQYLFVKLKKLLRK